MECNTAERLLALRRHSRSVVWFGSDSDLMSAEADVRSHRWFEVAGTKASTQLRRAPWRSPVLVSEVFKGARSAGASHWRAASVKDAGAGDRAVEATADAGLVLFDRQDLLATIENLEALKQDVERAIFRLASLTEVTVH